MEIIQDRLILRFSNKKEVNEIINLVKDGFDIEIFDKLIYSCKGVEKYISENIENPDSQIKYISVIINNILVAFVEYRYLSKSINLNYIVINRSFRGKGLSSIILKKSLDLLDSKYKKLTLDVINSNERALNWYRKEGFVEQDKTYWYIIVLKNNNLQSSNVLITNENDAKIQFEKYGFCMLNLLSEQEYQVGLLGEKWIRIYTIDILKNINVLSFLKLNFPARNFFMLSNENIDKYPINNAIELKYLFFSYRMELNVNV